MTITHATDDSFTALYMWDPPSAGSGQMIAKEHNGRLVMSGGVLHYSFEKNLDAQGRLIGMPRTRGTPRNGARSSRGPTVEGYRYRSPDC